MTLRLPPRFVNVPARDVFGDMPDPLFRTLIQLHGLGWETPKGQPVRTPPATVLDLAAVRKVTERQMYTHLKDLKARGRIQIEHLGRNQIVVYLQGWKIDDSPPDEGSVTEAELAALAGDAAGFTEEDFSETAAPSNEEAPLDMYLTRPGLSTRTSWREPGRIAPSMPAPVRADDAGSSASELECKPGAQAAVFFRPWLEGDQLDEPQRLTLDEAAEKLLVADGEWYFSEADLADVERAGEYGPEEMKVQAALDARLLDDGRVILIADDGSAPEVLPLAEIARRSAQSQWARPIIRYSLWEFLSLTAPENAREKATRRRETLERLQVQAEAWGDPDLVVALGMEPFFISPNDARQIVALHGVDAVGGWLRALRANPGNAQSPAAVLIGSLRKGKAPPSGGTAEKKKGRWFTNEEYERFFQH
jgi:hypothetical protein